MNDELHRFLKSISYEEKIDDLNGLEIEKVLLNRSKETFEVIMKKDTVLPYEVAYALLLASKNGINNKEKCKITLKYDTVNDENFLDYLKEILKI